MVAVAVVVAFFICWAPFHLQRLMVIYLKHEDWTPALNVVFNVLYYISGILYYVSSTINPILYNIMSLKFRQAFKNTIFKSCRRKRIRRQQRKRKQEKYYNQTYKFCNNRPYTDTRLTVLHGNPYFNRLRRGVPDPNFLAAQKSNSSSVGSGGSSARMLNHEDPFDEIELDNIIECKSVSCNSPRTCAVNANFRPYHSFA